jgi:hypothetical protein
MFDATTTALLRAVHEDVCQMVSPFQTTARVHVASKILEAASGGERSVEGLTRIGRHALREATCRSH